MRYLQCNCLYKYIALCNILECVLQNLMSGVPLTLLFISKFFSLVFIYSLEDGVTKYILSCIISCIYIFPEDWDREKLLEAWMSNPESCCQRSGVQMPTPPPSGYNAWDTLPSPRTPRTTRSSLTSPDEISPSPGDIETAVVSL